MIAYILNLIDLCFTLHALQHGAVEANPFMQSVPVMIIYKIFIIGALCWWLGHRPEIIARYGLKIIAIIYGCINLWHIYNIYLV